MAAMSLALPARFQFNGLANAQMIVALNAGIHRLTPVLRAIRYTRGPKCLNVAETAAPGVGAVRLRLVATKQGAAPFALKGDDGKYAPEVLLDLDYWALMPL